CVLSFETAGDSQYSGDSVPNGFWYHWNHPCRRGDGMGGTTATECKQCFSNFIYGCSGICFLLYIVVRYSKYDCYGHTDIVHIACTSFWAAIQLRSFR